MQMNPVSAVSALARGARRRQTGLTLIELMVALAMGIVVTLAAVAALIVSRQGFTAVDSAAQLRENARFAAEMIQRVGVQAGYEDVFGGHSTRLPSAPAEPGIQGYDNAWVTLAGLPGSLANASRPSSPCGASDTSCLNGSDVLVARYWGTSNATGAADGAMVNCAGIPEPEKSAAVGRAYSIFHVSRSPDGEPALSCTYRDPTTNAWATVELVKGVEGFQVLYGVDAVTANTAPPAGNQCLDSVPDRYLTATQMVVPGNAAATTANWQRVRSLRIGMLFRGDVGSAQTRQTGSWNVLGDGAVSAADVGSNLVTTADGRLRHRLVFTVHLRNQQGFEVCLPTALQPCQNAGC